MPPEGTTQTQDAPSTPTVLSAALAQALGSNAPTLGSLATQTTDAGETTATGTEPTSTESQTTDPGTLDLSDTNPSETPADGRPEWLPEKFWKAGDNGAAGEAQYEELATSYKALEQKLSERPEAAPERPEKVDAYLNEWDTAKIRSDLPRLNLSDDDAELKRFADAAFKHGLSVEQARGVATDYLTAANSAMPEAVTEEAVLQELGTDGVKMTTEVATWVAKLRNENVIDDAGVQALALAGFNAASLKALHAIRTHALGTSAPDPHATGVQTRTARMDASEVNAGFADPRYKSDPVFRKRIQDAARANLNGGGSGDGASAPL